MTCTHCTFLRLEINVVEKNHSKNVHYNPLASKQNREKLSAPKFYSFIASVVDTGDYPVYSNIFASFRKKFEMAPIGYSGP